MKKYELVVIYNPDLEESKDKLLKNLQDILSKEDITVSSSNWWGKKKLSYEIAKQETGLYLFCEIDTNNTHIEQLLGKFVKNNDNIIRYLLVKKEGSAEQNTKKQK